MLLDSDPRHWTGMGYVDVQKLACVLPDGRVLFDDVSFRVGDGAKTALVGANGTGKTTLLRMVAGDLAPAAGAVARTGGLGVMRQFIGSVRDDTHRPRPAASTSRRRPSATAGRALDAAELAMMETDDEKTQMRYAAGAGRLGRRRRLRRRGAWDICTTAALGVPYDRASTAMLHTLSGGEQKRLALEALLRGPDEVLLLDEPDNYLDVPGKRWLEAALADSPQDGAVRQPRPRAARPLGRPGSSPSRRTAPGCTAAASRPTTRPGRPGATGSRSCTSAGRRSTSGCASWSSRCASRPRSAPTWPAATAPMQTRCDKFQAAGPPPEQVVDQKVDDAARRRPHRRARADLRERSS